MKYLIFLLGVAVISCGDIDIDQTFAPSAYWMDSDESDDYSSDSDLESDDYSSVRELHDITITRPPSSPESVGMTGPCSQFDLSSDDDELSPTTSLSVVEQARAKPSRFISLLDTVPTNLFIEHLFDLLLPSDLLAFATTHSAASRLTTASCMYPSQFRNPTVPPIRLVVAKEPLQDAHSLFGRYDTLRRKLPIHLDLRHLSQNAIETFLTNLDALKRNIDLPYRSQNIVGITIRKRWINMTIWKALAGLTSLEMLDLEGSQFVRPRRTPLAHSVAKNGEHEPDGGEAPETAITAEIPEDAQHPCWRALRIARLSNTRFNDHYLPSLDCSTNLNEIDVSYNTELTATALTTATSHWPELRTVILSAMNLLPANLTAFANNSKIERLDTSLNLALTSPSFAELLPRWQLLAHLNWSGMALPSDQLSILQDPTIAPNLKELRVGNDNMCTNTDFATLRRLRPALEIIVEP